MKLNEDEAKAAWAAIFSSVYGRAAYETLRSITMEIISADSSALHEHNGRRSLAAQLMALAVMEPATNEYERTRTSEAPRKSKRHGPAGR